MNNKEFWKEEWLQAEKIGKVSYAKHCKESYRECVMSEIIKPYHFYHDKLKPYPLIILN